MWTAEQQKWWYEVAKRSMYAHAVRCRDCRQKRRAEKEEQRRRCEAGRKRKEELGDR
ncbi:MAG: zinc-ribbon domain containing protein [Microcoleus sp. PH2017_10_PVI_O_A]|nr:zinc-ribbon domain containing protein [Microcoleus sp. PH2017_10_PVI_O_A]MCC3461485.1 zinc-ribbon domain containing protein [Microcoleus sp. PH2017_11_PCY_U_A]MCC3479959.1 zinc-ribbon domain containing protein [Microcoleus sp. PH2017_12_PCY_D_A]MCC3528615.1 zinc-ribbon domain containing protein [Microcoleus sp. PH2017_21_RUC_O_A]MCC3540902.1 zinc-ribbon domain containing protein [Microcoleus sp. PH2017_22_RUC_O_B]MCC3560543.1 zinc-ribbon domain containing protein [Microcoleus sp. PH2017_27_